MSNYFNSDRVDLLIDLPLAQANAETIDKGYGRIEVRRCRLTTDIDWLKQRHPDWVNLNSIVAIESEWHIGETVSTETRYFISSKLASAPKMLAAVRSHWGIENQIRHELWRRPKPYSSRQRPNQRRHYPSRRFEHDTSG